MLMQFREFFREPAILFWSFGFPIAIAAALGFAFTAQEEPTRTVAVITQDAQTIDSLQQLVQSAPDTTRIRFIPATEDSAILQLKRGQINLYLSQNQTQWQAHYDPQNTEARLTYLLLQQSLEPASSPMLTQQRITTPGQRYIDFLIPGLIALGIMNSLLWGMGWSLIEMRIKKLLRRIIATPLARSTFLLSYLFTRTILALLEALIVFLFSYLLFGVTIQGSGLAALLAFLGGIVAFGGVSVLISSRTDRTHIGNGLINVFVLPMTILSGIFFSYRSFPEWAVAVIEKLPLTLLADALREIFIEGATLPDVLPQIVGLFAFGITFFLIGLRIYKWY
uniref:ABC transporter permease n=1 Tax=Roseihalotalea indica TaxID=2867963 RepID=A0AA49JIM3_9BACT|nr:ABC transporter permease [Tunicatimonas sp. TK19036]